MKPKDSCTTFAIGPIAVQFAVSCKLVMVLVCESTRKFSLTVSGVLLQTSNQFCGGESVCVPPQFLVCPALQALRLAKVTITQLSPGYNGHHIFWFLLPLPKNTKKNKSFVHQLWYKHQMAWWMGFRQREIAKNFGEPSLPRLRLLEALVASTIATPRFTFVGSLFLKRLTFRRVALWVK